MLQISAATIQPLLSTKQKNRVTPSTSFAAPIEIRSDLERLKDFRNGRTKAGLGAK
jgi:hypothetical protein